MKILLDSHAVYWWTIGSDRLSTKARSLIEDKANAILVSAVTFYELDNKMRLNKLDLKPRNCGQPSRKAACKHWPSPICMPNLQQILIGNIAIRGTGFLPLRRGLSTALSSRRIWRSMRFCMSESGKGSNGEGIRGHCRGGGAI